MDTVLELRIRHVMDLLDDAEVDIGNLAIAGESLRRHAALYAGADETPTIATLLHRYEARVAGLDATVGSDVGLMLIEALAELERFAGESLATRDFEYGDDFLRAISGVLALARVQVSTGRRSVEELEEFAAHASRSVHAIAPRLPDLWDTAEWMAICVGPDPDYPWLYEWVEELAALSPQRMIAGSLLRASQASRRLLRSA